MTVDQLVGAEFRRGIGTRFQVWAPEIEQLKIHITGPTEQLIAMTRGDHGYHEALVAAAVPGTRYLVQLSAQQEYPDPASRFQPEGVHGPSEVIDTEFPWTDGNWKGIPLQNYVTYELHVGTYTGEGTFEAIIPYLPSLRQLGITAIELMPIAQFPGSRNWGYDGAYPYAAQSSYGGPWGLQKLVDAAHAQELAVVLDVVYNHLGPEGSYLSNFGPYFTERYKTPWGAALNFDGPDNEPVRRFFVENALYWITHFHIDALRLDAIHAIADRSAYPFLRDVTDAVHQQSIESGRPAYVIAESDLNDPRVIQPVEKGGLGFDAQWSDDFHHALHAILTGERSGYYQDFGDVTELAAALRDSYVYANRYSTHRRRRHGAPLDGIDTDSFLVYAQNHDQVGNRMNGDRLSTLISYERLKLAAGAVVLSPFLPMLFMGEEYGETAPFMYFVSHSDQDLIDAVRKGRRQEFAAFRWDGDPPDPQDERTFHQSKLNHELTQKTQHAILLDFHRELIALRSHRALQSSRRQDFSVEVPEKSTLLMRRRCADDEMLFAFNFGNDDVRIKLAYRSRLIKRIASSDQKWSGPADAPQELDPEATLTVNPHSFVAYEKDQTS